MILSYTFEGADQTIVCILGVKTPEVLMADVSDRTERKYIYNGTLKFLVSENHQERIGYRGKRQYNKLGNLAAHAVSWEKTQKNCRPIANSQTGSPINDVSFKLPGFFLSNSGTSIQQCIDDATIKFYNEAANTNALLPLILKERQQTIDMVSEKVLKLAALKRNFLREMRKTWRTNDHKIVQNRWLEYRYGWLPTIADINTLVNKPLGLPGVICSGRATKRYDATGYKEGRWEYDQNGTISTLVQALLLPKDPFSKTGAQYGITNPSLVAWEMVPYSFIVDWVFNVGGYLEHLGALNGLEVINPTYSWRHTFFQQSFLPAGAGFTSGYGAYKGSYGARNLGVPRYPNPFIPNNGMNLSRFFDAAALLKGQFDRFRR